VAERGPIGRRSIPNELRPGRRHPFRYSGEAYQAIGLPITVTCQTKVRKRVLVEATAEIVIGTLEDAARRRDARLLAYCAMPDHLHFAIDLAAHDDPPRLLRYFKGEASRRVNVAWGSPGRFRRQRSYWDTFADDLPGLLEAIEYIMENPVRWGLCEAPEDWPYSADLTND